MDDKDGRILNCKNGYQGDHKKVLCVCSAGLLRSPTAAVVLSQEPFNFNTRAAGMEKIYALIPLDEVLIEWADEIVCMSEHMKSRLSDMTTKPIINLEVPDIYNYRHPKLMQIIKENYLKHSKVVS